MEVVVLLVEQGSPSTKRFVVFGKDDTWRTSKGIVWCAIARSAGSSSFLMPHVICIGDGSRGRSEEIDVRCYFSHLISIVSSRRPCC